MKRFLLLISFLSIVTLSYSQSDIADLYVGDIIDVNEISIEFVELIADSRCPKNVNCIRAGEAEVLVAVYKNRKFSHEKVLIFHANGMVKEDNMNLFVSEQLFIRGLTLSPYPKGLTKVREEDYMLTVGIN